MQDHISNIAMDFIIEGLLTAKPFPYLSHYLYAVLLIEAVSTSTIESCQLLQQLFLLLHHIPELMELGYPHQNNTHSTQTCKHGRCAWKEEV